MSTDGNGGTEPGSALQVSVRVQREDLVLDVDFTVGPSEVVAVLGPNGAGKTTLLRTLAGLSTPSRGRILLNGQPLLDTERGIDCPPEHRPVGYVFQNYRLFPHLSVRENVAFAARSSGIHRAQARRQAEHWLERFGLRTLAARRPGQLSGGQSQRVALARALAADPALLLLDEPMAALDARTKLEVRSELRRHLADFAGPTLVVTHDPLEALVMADRLLVIEGGRIVQAGQPADIARRPATEYVARLVGLNLYPGRQGLDGAIDLDGGGRLFATGAPADARDRPTTTERVLAALRPSAIALHTSRPENSSPRNLWEGRITGLELLLERVRIEISGSPSAIVDVTPAAVAELKLAPGTRVWLSAKATEIDVYPDPAEPVANVGEEV